MNELKLSLQNFQSISEGELTFRTGLNFIIGQSNSGKSATFRALKACLLNPAGSKHFIKKGSGKATVTLSYNGNDISWSKTEKANSYLINGEDYRNTGRSDAFKILDGETGFVRGEKSSVLMNVEEELQLPFPFGISDQDLFKLFENVFCISDSAVILKSAKDHESKVKYDIEMLELERTKIQVKLNSLSELKEEVDIQKLEDFKEKLVTNKSRLLNLKEGLPEIKRACRVSNANLEVSERYFEDLCFPYFEALDCKRVLSQTRGLHELSKSFEEIHYVFIPKLEKLKELGGLKKLANQLKLLGRVEVSEKLFISKIEKYLELRKLNKTLQNLKKLHKLEIKEQVFGNKYVKLNELRTLRSYISKVRSEVQMLQGNKKREEENVLRIEDKLKKFEVCPLCHHSLKDN